METRPLLLGHRGARGVKSILENSLPAFDFALAAGCDGFEFDVRLSGDGHAVVCHDARHDGLSVSRCSAAKLSLPLLEDVLGRYRKKAFLDIELKVAGLEKIVVDLLKKDLLKLHPPKCGFVVSSFLPEVLREIYRLNASVPLGLICETPAQLRRWPELPLEYVIPHYKLATENLISKSKRSGKKILVWTVNSAPAVRRFAELGADGIISDNPQRLAQALMPLHTSGTADFHL